MPVNPIVVLRVNKWGDVTNDRNNIGDDLKIIVCQDTTEFENRAAGMPYSGISPGPGQTQVLAMRKK